MMSFMTCPRGRRRRAHAAPRCSATLISGLSCSVIVAGYARRYNVILCYDTPKDLNRNGLINKMIRRLSTDLRSVGVSRRFYDSARITGRLEGPWEAVV
ncbi:hypothetical protein EVAR_38703_1 [Eumeta japonica]|uniref:Uncharacterized protein n=1 Tax=Eumeta variegata TaxID=151549 RepID=A0A4C1XJW1_EUMVA|nr:hypothetical protein EVAR_38703_1 [Eumeta japonica]